MLPYATKLKAFFWVITYFLMIKLMKVCYTVKEHKIYIYHNYLLLYDDFHYYSWELNNVAKGSFYRLNKAYLHKVNAKEKPHLVP